MPYPNMMRIEASLREHPDSGKRLLRLRVGDEVFAEFNANPHATKAQPFDLSRLKFRWGSYELTHDTSLGPDEFRIEVV